MLIKQHEQDYLKRALTSKILSHKDSLCYDLKKLKINDSTPGLYPQRDIEILREVVDSRNELITLLYSIMKELNSYNMPLVLKLVSNVRNEYKSLLNDIITKNMEI